MTLASMNDLKDFLDTKVAEYNVPGFIQNDPVSIPHLFSKKQDIEIAGLFAAVLAWGQRKTIINKSHELMGMMDNSPHSFLKGSTDRDLKPFLSFKHRTFNATDTLYFIHFLKDVYSRFDSLEMAFLPEPSQKNAVFSGLNNFYEYFISLESFPGRTKKHIQSPAKKSACKRLNMFLRWMVRKDNKGVDFGLWTNIKPHQLICPCDLHVDRVARKLGLIQRKQTDWITAVELTTALRQFDPDDPVKYDFALFGLGIEEKY